MVFESFAHVPVTEELLRHVWEGEADPAKGGHRFGLGRELKTEFPEDWDLARVELAINLVLSQPQSIRRRGTKVTCLKQVGMVIVGVYLVERPSGVTLVTAYPDCGDGVYLNVKGKPVSQPLDISRLES